MTTLFAQPYLYGVTGFYFDTLEAFETGMKRLNAYGIEEVEIQFIEGESYQATLFGAAGISQGNVYQWFEHLEDVKEDAASQMSYLLELGYSLQEALDKHDDVILYFGSARDYAQEPIEDTTTDIPAHLVNYIDYDAIARDLCLGGDITEIRYEVYVTNAHEF